MLKSVGVHYIVEFVNCDVERMNDAQLLETALLEAVRISGAVYLSHAVHRFVPHGMTVVVLIGESHFALHTWPEYRYVAFDILTCGTMDAKKAIAYLSEQLGAEECRVQTHERGF